MTRGQFWTTLNVLLDVSVVDHASDISVIFSLKRCVDNKQTCNYIVHDEQKTEHLLRVLGALYDRIIAIRLNRWLGVSDEQSAYQKLKSTLHHLFTIKKLPKKRYDSVHWLFRLSKSF